MTKKTDNKPHLHVISNDGRAHRVPILKDEITIGRSKDNDITIGDNTVSRHHARIVKTKEGYLLNDFGSFNGTQVNAKRIQNVILKHNDRIRIGRANLTFLTKSKTSHSTTDSVIISPETDLEKEDQKIVNSSPEVTGQKDLQDLLISPIKLWKGRRAGDRSRPSEKIEQQSETKEDITSLERMNKVLFVLYEISRQLHSITDLYELLQKIMDLIFMVIDADYGYLILTGDKDDEELLPVVVKRKEDTKGDKKELTASRTIINKVIHDKVALLTSNAMADTRLDHGKSLMIQQIRSAMCVPLWKKDQIIGVIQLDSVRLDNQFTDDDLQLLKAIGSQMAMVIEQASLNEQIREEERMRSRLERFHSPQIIEMILKGGQETKDNIMDPQDLTATILFTDIVGFTPLSEQMPPREVNMILNQFFSRMTDIIFEYGGTLDKYTGDGLMAVFGAPMEKEGDAERAIQAAQKMRQDLEQMMKTGELIDFKIRIGINTGRVVAGNVGSPKRMDYTVIGDPVNIASRLESMAEPNQILVGEETFQHVKGKFLVNKVGLKTVKGRSSKIMVYEVLD